MAGLEVGVQGGAQGRAYFSHSTRDLPNPDSLISSSEGSKGWVTYLCVFTNIAGQKGRFLCKHIVEDIKSGLLDPEQYYFSLILKRKLNSDFTSKWEPMPCKVQTHLFKHL